MTRCRAPRVAGHSALRGFPVRHGLLAAAAVALLLPACSLRDRSNPLDPENRTTRGRLTGFNVLAGDAVVELRWIRLTQTGVVGYRIERWRPGASPAPLFGADFEPHVVAAEDPSVQNDSTYVYRLVALFASGDSAVSYPDTATPGLRRPLVLVSSLPGYVGLSPDVRDVLYERAASDPYDDLELDRARGIFWLTQYERGTIVRRRFEGSTVGVVMTADRPTDLTVVSQRGNAWVALPATQRVVPYGLPDTNTADPGTPITGVGPARIVEANNTNATIWIGADDGGVHLASAGAVTRSWSLPGRVLAIAVDEAVDGAWVAIRANELSDLYFLSAAAGVDPVLRRTGLLNVTDIEVDPENRSLWLCERGAPLTGNGRLSRLDPSDGQTVMAIGGLEPYAIEIDRETHGCWVTDLRSDRLLEVAPEGPILRRSPPLGVPYGVRIHRP